MLGVICESALVQVMPEPSPVSALRTETFQQVERFAQSSTVSPLCASEDVPKGQTKGVTLLPRRCVMARRCCHLSDSKVKSLLSKEKRVILFSFQKYNWVF